MEQNTNDNHTQARQDHLKECDAVSASANNAATRGGFLDNYWLQTVQ